MRPIKILSIVPYKILPAKLGGEKGIALFNEYLGLKASLVAVSTKNNEAGLARNYTMLRDLSNSRTRYINPFLFFKLRSLAKKQQATHLVIEHPYYAWLAFLLKHSLHIPLIIHSHNIEFMRSRSIGRWWWKALKAYEKWAYGMADMSFFISDDDRQFAEEQLSVDPLKSFTVTYGIEENQLPNDMQGARLKVMQQHGISAEEKILLFNGALYHHTNYDAVKVILDEINPRLMDAGLKYKIIICGKGLPPSFNDLKEYHEKNIIYAGFVDDISLYFKAADIFLNPIMAGGGIKTKAVEAIAYNCTVVSTELGALGIKREMCGEKLYVFPDGDWKGFTDKILSLPGVLPLTPKEFYDYYYWDNIVSRAFEKLQQLNA